MRKRVLRVSIALLVVAVLGYAVFRVTYTHIPESRLAAAEMHSASSALRQQVAEAAIELVLEYTPVPGAGAVNWRCTGTPQRDMPLACRSGT